MENNVMTSNVTNVPVEKLRFVQKSDLSHDLKLATKPVSYMQGAFRRFCKNKGAIFGAIVILILVLFSIFGPIFTPYTPAYQDTLFANVRPKSKLFADTNFWDGCMEKSVGTVGYLQDKALALETGKDVIKGGVDNYELSDGGTVYNYRVDTYYNVGFGKYKKYSVEKFNDIQRYQNETGRQVLYPIVAFWNRNPESTTTIAQQDMDNANLYYKTKVVKGKTVPDLDEDGNFQLNYWSYREGKKSSTAADYNSLRIEGENGFVDEETGATMYYVYGRYLQGGDTIECRVDTYEYYRYEHTQVLKDGIEDAYFIFGTTSDGKDIFACLSYGARFSFIFALIVAVANMFVGVIWGSIAGYFGGRIDLFMERFTDVLGAVPTMIVITLLKYHMGASVSQALILFIAFFATGWIGMAGTTRMQFYRYKNQEYILAARTLGARDARIMFKHILPNAIGTLVTSCALIIPSMIYSETSLSYLGIINLEVGEITSVGTLIAAGQQSLVTAPYVVLFPSAFLMLLMLSFNLFGNGLRDAFNPSLRGSEE